MRSCDSGCQARASGIAKPIDEGKKSAMDSIEAPFGEVIELRQIIHDSGVPLLRVIIRDGGRYTKVELDPASAHRWGRTMQHWAETVAAERGD
jgi:hypothetical protein